MTTSENTNHEKGNEKPDEELTDKEVLEKLFPPEAVKAVDEVVTEGVSIEDHD